MKRRLAFPVIALVFAACEIALSAPAMAENQEQNFKSHPPTRPLPSASQRPMSQGPAYFVDGNAGDDANNGRRETPWRTVQHAVSRIVAGDVLYLRGGVYYEHVVVSACGTTEKPITIRSFPGELVVIDGGIREFAEAPDSAWEPCPGGVDGEFHSVKTYPDLGGSEGATNVLGNFADSMMPLHGYRYITDLRSANEYFYKLNAGKTEAGDGVYCGPGIFYDVKTQRIHVRLARTNQKALGDDNYRGETDPRKLPLVIAGLNAGPALSINDARYLRIQDLVVRGARTATISVNNSFNIEFDGVAAYGGSSAMAVRDCGGLRLWNCGLRGIAAPWTYRGSLKYRAIEARIFSASGWAPTGADNHDFELAYSEFTDCVDGVFIGNVKNVRFHHNLLDNISDDGIFLTATTAYDGTTPGGNVHIYQNLLSRCLTTFAFGVGHGRQKMTPQGRQTGAGVFIYRNIFDFRRPVMYTQPKEDESQITSYGRVAGDHGGPLWEPMTIYHNTFLHVDPPWRGYYLSGLGSHLAGGSMRRLFNNLVVQASGTPGNVFPQPVPPQVANRSVTGSKKPNDPLDDLLDGKPKKNSANSLEPADLAELKKDLDAKSQPKAPLPVDFQTDGNLHWSYAEKPTVESTFARFRGSSDFETSKQLYAPGWAMNDVVGDPLLRQFDADWRTPLDCRMRDTSPAIDKGVLIPHDWPDPLRKAERGKPDIGAIPAGSAPWRVGIGGRLTVFRSGAAADDLIAAPTDFLVRDEDLPPRADSSVKTNVAIVQGYPAFDAPLLEFALRRAEVPFDSLQRMWLDPADYAKHNVVIVVGDLARARIEPNKFSADELAVVERFMQRGGTLMLMRGNTALFNTQDGRAFLAKLTGTNRATRDQMKILIPNHAWVRHLDARQDHKWLNASNVQPLRATKGELIIGDNAGLASLYRLVVGKGQLIYVGWDISASLPHGRLPSTVENETNYERQMQILANIITSITRREANVDPVRTVRDADARR